MDFFGVVAFSHPLAYVRSRICFRSVVDLSTISSLKIFHLIFGAGEFDPDLSEDGDHIG